MQAIFLVLAAAIVPFAWGWTAHWLLERCWPRRTGAGAENSGRSSAEYFDYQI